MSAYCLMLVLLLSCCTMRIHTSDLEKLLEENKLLSHKIEILQKEKEILEKEQERNRNELVWRRGDPSPANVTLDSETAHPRLILSNDLKSVRLGNTTQELPDNPKRFTSDPCILGSKGFSYGMHTWEVEVGDEGDRAVGAMKESVGRKEDFPRRHSPEKGTWAVYLTEESLKSMGERPKKLGVHLSFDCRKLNIYNAETMKRIWTFYIEVDEKIFPFFCIGPGAEMKITDLEL
uniref:Butyrophilin subfamily 1 member A1-like isoform X2 n=1 Tax=Geotrypetes seraphini TaxID=260995 RepID=A0A6P8NRX1_GEOSA|nr:butyrophilin subfamily 1 member A1-like isoform X2 [Geotrypetes seraphini]